MTALEQREKLRDEFFRGTFVLPEVSPFLFARTAANPLGPLVRWLTPEMVGRSDRWFFIGDIHGDLLALHRQLQFIKATEPDFRIVLLGDIADRGKDSAECFLLLLRWAKQYPGQVAWIAGNHDICFSFDEAQGKFASSVEPAEFLDFLNGGPPDTRALRQSLGRTYMRLADGLPRAMFFPDGLLVTHGGFPLVDLQARVAPSPPLEELFFWLNQDDCLQDFTWTRLTTYPKKIPNRFSKGCSYGFKDFEAFCRLFPDGRPVRRLLTGHEHHDEGWVVHEKYAMHPAATLTGFGFATVGSPDKYRDKLFVARHRENQLPQGMEILTDPSETAAFLTANP